MSAAASSPLTERFERLRRKTPVVVVGTLVEGRRDVVVLGESQGGFEESIFEVGSITKTFTALLLAEMSESGEIALSSVMTEPTAVVPVLRPRGPPGRWADNWAMFTVEERDRVREHVLELARGDARVVAGAEVGSLALGGGDHWSDLDLTFGITDGIELTEILDDWTSDLVSRFDAVHLFDFVADPAVYRVLLLADYLQLDVSVAPASTFRSTSPRFKLLFGEANDPEHIRPPTRDDTLGWSVLYARHARICIEREHWWQAEFCITHLRYYGMELACLRHDLPAYYGKGFDRLPAEDGDAFEGAIVRSLDRDELLRALIVGVKGLLRECELGNDDERIRQRLREMAG